LADGLQPGLEPSRILGCLGIENGGNLAQIRERTLNCVSRLGGSGEVLA
jgi:hypothetical protein